MTWSKDRGAASPIQAERDRAAEGTLSRGSRAAPLRALWLAPRHRDASREGALLVLAVALAYFVSEALHLPESFWAVMSALIVARGGHGATLDAGWQRVRGVALGTAVGLGGAWLHRAGFARDATTIAAVGVLAFASARGPALRSAPISALIVLTSGGIGAHSALQVAGLRAFEIAIGVAAAVLVGVAAGAARDRARFVAAAAALLRELGAECIGAATDAADREPSRRTALRGLAALAQRAAAEGRWTAARDARAAADWSVRTARLLARIAQDAALFGRLGAIDPQARAGAAQQLAAKALAEAANLCEHGAGAVGHGAPLRGAIAALEQCAAELERDAAIPAGAAIPMGVAMPAPADIAAHAGHDAPGAGAAGTGSTADTGSGAARLAARGAVPARLLAQDLRALRQLLSRVRGGV